MIEHHDLGYRSLKDLVYDYLRSQMIQGELKAGDAINMDRTAGKLGISKTPLREALIKLESEGFVKIVPWQGVFVKQLTLEEFEDCYQIMSGLESVALLCAAPAFTPDHARRMRDLNGEMREAINHGDFEAYSRKNLEFHRTYIGLAGNPILAELIDILKKRLYEFSRPKEFLPEWEEMSLAEHDQLIERLEKEDFEAAAAFLRTVIWSFDRQKDFIIKYYKFEKSV